MNWPIFYRWKFFAEICPGISAVTRQSLKCVREVFLKGMIGNVNRPFIAVDQCFLYSEGRQPKKMVVAFSVYIQYMFVVV